MGSGTDEEVEQTEIPDVLPVLPLKNTVLFPFLLSPLLVNSARSKRLIDEVLLTPDRLLMCAAVRRPVEGSPAADDVYRVGTVMRIVKMLKFPDDSYRLLVQGVARARVEEFASEEPFLRGRIETPARDRRRSTRSRRRRWCATWRSSSPRWSPRARVCRTSCRCSPRTWTTPRSSADLVGSNLEFDVAGKQSLLEELDVPDAAQAGARGDHRASARP